MSGKTTSFVLGPKFEAFIAEEVATGEYQNASEVMREALRMLKRRKERRAARDAYHLQLIDEGLASEIVPETHEEIWANIRTRRAARNAG